MSKKCSSCGKKIGGYWHSEFKCEECGYWYCVRCCDAGVVGNGKCPRCGGKCKKNPDE